ncbi:hypothetical protein V7S43_016964 [Phytophthora oleae]|uniref:Uncharacterized protein n=1 Tax=Phytophthora oleae TaxID=2107226 RepID=A0ABD3EXR8_9STRA
MERATLPQSVAQGIREDYERLVGSSPAPSGQNKAQKRRYIDALGLSDLPEDQKLLLYPEYPIVVPGLKVSGFTDWMIKKGDRMLIVLEAKGCDIEKGYHQLLGMMEALRINNKILKLPQKKMKAICTDFQNWLFVEREAYTLRKDIQRFPPMCSTRI